MKKTYLFLYIMLFTQFVVDSTLNTKAYGAAVLSSAYVDPDEEFDEIDFDNDDSQGRESDVVIARPIPAAIPKPVVDDNFVTSNRRSVLAGSRRVPAVTWNGCKGKVRGGYTGSRGKCTMGTINPNYAAHLNKYFLKCISSSAKKAGIKAPSSTFLSHMGTYNNRGKRGGRSLSNHAYARAIDIAAVKLYDSNGKNYFTMRAHVRKYKGKNKTMYNSFRQCWKNSLRKTCGRKGSIGIPHSHLGGNRKHNDHIHLEFHRGC